MMRNKKNIGLKKTKNYQNQLKNSLSSKILYRMGTKTKELQDPHQEKNHNLKIYNTSSKFTFFLPEPIKTTNYECGLVEIKFPSIEFKEKKIENKLLEIEFYNDRMGISANVQDVLDEIVKCIKFNDLKSINYKKKIESIILKLDSKNYNLSLIGDDEYIQLLDAIEKLLKLLKEDKPENSKLIEIVTKWELHKLFEENKHENSKLIEIVTKWEDNVYQMTNKKYLKLISTEIFNNSDLIDTLTDFVSKKNEMIEFEMNSGQFLLKTNQNTSLKFKNFVNFAPDMIQVQKSLDDKPLLIKLIKKRENVEKNII